MVAGDSPAVARHRLRHTLREAREAKHLTQKQVAKALEWSLSKVNRIESGDVTVSRTDLQAMLQLYEITDSDQVGELIDEARASRRRRGWWDQPKFRKNLTPALIELLQFEVDAKAIFLFQPTVIPGILQTRAYAEAILEYWRDDLSDAERNDRAEARIRRRKAVVDRDDLPQFRVILDESTLRRHVGGATVMIEQLEELLELANRPNLAVRIVPFSAGVPMVRFGAFSICDVGGHESLLYREKDLTDETVDGREEIDWHRDLFAKMWDLSLSESASKELIEASTHTLRAFLKPAAAG